MNNIIKKVVVTTMLMFGLSFGVYADEFGMTFGFQADYDGTAKLYVGGGDEKLESIGTPHSMFFLLDNIKLSYLEYEQFVDDVSYSCCVNWNHYKTQITSVSYQDVLKYIGNGEFYGNFGAGLFQSQMTHNYTYRSDTYDDYGKVTRGKTDKQFDISPIAGLGVKWELSKGFMGVDLTWIFSKKVIYEYQYGSQKYETDEIDLGGKIISLTTGIKF